jgi:hypothetical protein
LLDRGLEVLDRLVVVVDAREAQVGDGVQGPQRAQDRQAHLVGLDLALPGGTQRLLDLLAQLGQVGLGDRAPLAGLPHPVDDLLAGERLHDPRPLHDHQLHLLQGRETLATGAALAPPPNRAAVLGHARVENP